LHNSIKLYEQCFAMNCLNLKSQNISVYAFKVTILTGLMQIVLHCLFLQKKILPVNTCKQVISTSEGIWCDHNSVPQDSATMRRRFTFSSSELKAQLSFYNHTLSICLSVGLLTFTFLTSSPEPASQNQSNLVHIILG
jgi:hypothetical protein